MVDVTDGADIHMRFAALELFLRHAFPSCSVYLQHPSIAAFLSASLSAVGSIQ
jgi:hypothetical protein